MKKQLIKGIALVTLGILLITASAQAQEKESGSFTVPLSDPGKRAKIKVHLNSGSIIVKGVPRKDLLIKYKAGDAGDERSGESKDGLKRISGGSMDLEVAETGNQVEVRSDSWHNQRALLEVEVPLGVDLQLSTYNYGHLTVQGVQGAVELTNYNGDITAESIAGSVVATTYNGKIKVTFEKVTDNAPMSFSTYNGDIDLTFPASLKASLKMKTGRGDIYTGFDTSPVKSTPVQKQETKSGTYKVIIDDWTKADINGGGAEVSMKTYNGNVYVRKK